MMKKKNSFFPKKPSTLTFNDSGTGTQAHSRQIKRLKKEKPAEQTRRLLVKPRKKQCLPFAKMSVGLL
jgi:hypothetical protein